MGIWWESHLESHLGHIYFMSRQTWSPFFRRHRKKLLTRSPWSPFTRRFAPRRAPGEAPSFHRRCNLAQWLQEHLRCGRLPDPNLTFTMKKMANTAAINSSRGTGSTPLGSTLGGLKKPGPGKWMKMPWYQPYIYIHCIYIYTLYIYSGWWFEPLWKIWVSWDYFLQYMEK